ncbi:MAG: carbohydrate kinase family protein [Bacteroidota bacterium]
MEKIKAVCFGEVLWDVFPNDKKIGGAPLNVALRMNSLEIETAVISQLGKDENGEEIRDYLKNSGITVDAISVTSNYPTGEVQVILNEKGSASYEIKHPAAWDKIEVSEIMVELTTNSDVFIFGSLVCRDEISRNSLFELLRTATYRVFDINLRPPHYKKEVLEHLLRSANFIKFNDDELFEISEMMGSKFNSLEQNIKFISETFLPETICVTKGNHGAVLFHKETWYYNSGYKIKVKDTVGAGDSFLASLIAKLLQKEEPQTALDFACAMGALVAGSNGANPEITMKQIQDFMFPE